MGDSQPDDNVDTSQINKYLGRTYKNINNKHKEEMDGPPSLLAIM